MKTQRERFEAWAVDTRGWNRVSLAFHYLYANYVHDDVQDAWQVWQAAEASGMELAAKSLDVTNAEIRLHAGEMTAQEMRTVTAILGWLQREIRALIAREE